MNCDFTRLRIESQTPVPCTSHESAGICERLKGEAMENRGSTIVARSDFPVCLRLQYRRGSVDLSPCFPSQTTTSPAIHLAFRLRSSLILLPETDGSVSLTRALLSETEKDYFVARQRAAPEERLVQTPARFELVR